MGLWIYLAPPPEEERRLTRRLKRAEKALATAPPCPLRATRFRAVEGCACDWCVSAQRVEAARKVYLDAPQFPGGWSFMNFVEANFGLDLEPLFLGDPSAVQQGVDIDEAMAMSGGSIDDVRDLGERLKAAVVPLLPKARRLAELARQDPERYSVRRWYETRDTADLAEDFISLVDFAEACIAAPSGSYVSVTW